jgi:hypothetical protein
LLQSIDLKINRDYIETVMSRGVGIVFSIELLEGIMNKITKLLVVALPLAFSMQAGVVSAANQVLTMVPSLGIPYGSGTLNTGANGVWTELENAAFNDAYTFNTTTLADLNVQFNNLNVGATTFSSLTGSLWKDNGAVGADGTDALIGNLTGGNAPNIFTSLASGNYYLNMVGVPDPLGGNGSTFGMHITVTPVPEPETYALMIGGLALVGFSARRRKTELDA